MADPVIDLDSTGSPASPLPTTPTRLARELTRLRPKRPITVDAVRYVPFE